MTKKKKMKEDLRLDLGMDLAKNRDSLLCLLDSITD